jgi:hypothetical protein
MDTQYTGQRDLRDPAGGVMSRPGQARPGRDLAKHLYNRYGDCGPIPAPHAASAPGRITTRPGATSRFLAEMHFH